MNLFKQLQATLKECENISLHAVPSIVHAVVPSVDASVSVAATAESHSHAAAEADADIDRSSCQSELDHIFRSATDRHEIDLTNSSSPSAIVSGVIHPASLVFESPLNEAANANAEATALPLPLPPVSASLNQSSQSSPHLSNHPFILQDDAMSDTIDDRHQGREDREDLLMDELRSEDRYDEEHHDDDDDGMDDDLDHEIVDEQDHDMPQQEFTHYRDIGLQSLPIQPAIRLQTTPTIPQTRHPTTPLPQPTAQASTATCRTPIFGFSPVPFGLGPVSRPAPEGINEEKNGSQPQVYMSIYRPQQNSKFGVAYYSISDETLYGGEFADLSAVQTLKYKIQPDVLVTAASFTQDLYQQLSSNELDPGHTFHVRTVAKREFAIDSAIQRLRLLRVEDLCDAEDSFEGMDEDTPGSNKLHHTLLLRSVIDFQQTVMLSSMGGLIFHLLQSAVFSQLEVDRLAKPVHIKSIKSIPTADVLMIDRGSMEGLGIFIQEPHPGSTNRSKEGFSVFALLNQTKTAQGSRTLRRWLENPSTNLEFIEKRLDHVEYFTLAENTDLVGQLRSNLRYVRDISRLIVKFHNRQASLADWNTFVAYSVIHECRVSQGLRHLLTIGELLSDRRSDLPLFRSLYDLFSNKLQQLLEEIESIVQLETSEVAPSEEGDDSAHVRAGIDSKLDHLRWIFSNLDRICRDEVENDLEVVSEILPRHLISAYSLTYLPQIGFLARIPVGKDGVESFRAKLEAEPVNAELKFFTTEHAYFKSMTASKLDEVYGDIQGVIVDLENAILKELQTHILQCADSLKQINEKVAELDCYLALAVAAVHHTLVRPEMTNDPVLVIQHGRHILQEKRVDTFVANSTALGIQKGSLIPTESASELNGEESGLNGGGMIHIITGPNSSGKSVYLKQVGIITYLAHTGAFVPAAKATIGLCDSILTRVKGLDSINSSYSTFAYDTSQVAYMLRHCTKRSLCLIDEYGKGTSNLDGVALLAGTIRHFEEQGSSCPKVLIATHFHELYTRKLIEETETISFWKMDFVSQDMADISEPDDEAALPPEKRAKHAEKEQYAKTSQHDPKSDAQMSPIICLYKLVPGLSKKSFGTNCAVNAGVPEPIIVRASQLANQIAAGAAIEPIDLVPGSALALTATPSSFQPQEEDVWFQFLAFVLFSVGQRPATEVAVASSEAVVKQHLKQDIQAGHIDAEQILLDVSTEQLEDLYVRFMQQSKPMLIARLRPNSVENFDPFG